MSISLGINDLKLIITSLTSTLKYDFSLFSTSFLKRRLAIVFEELNVKKIDSFIENLNDPAFADKFYNCLAVPASELFRDPSFWRSLRSKVLVAESNLGVIWFPDSSSVEEIFSLQIILAELNLLNRFEIHCNHQSNLKLLDIKQGVLRAKNIDINENNFKRFGVKGSFLEYFDLTDSGYLLKELYRGNILLHNNHFMKQRFDNKPSIVIFRNSMLYFTKRGACEALIAIYNEMAPKGFLAIGIKEDLHGPIVGNMVSFDSAEKIYMRHPASVTEL